MIVAPAFAPQQLLNALKTVTHPGRRDLFDALAHIASTAARFRFFN
jgi:hypothetical protein